jgi:hypothetical protein
VPLPLQTDFERRLQRQDEVVKITTSKDPAGTAEAVLPEAAALYRRDDLSLKDGESMKVEVKRKTTGEAGGGFLARLGGVQSSSLGVGRLAPLAPPPAPTPPPAPRPASSGVDLLAADAAAAAFGDLNFQGAAGGAASPSPSKPAATTEVASTEEGWASF